MALDVGSITIDENGDVTGDGLSLAIYNGTLSALSIEERRPFAEGMKPFSEGLAAAIIDHLTANAEITVTVGVNDDGLQDGTLAPAAPVELETKGTLE